MYRTLAEPLLMSDPCHVCCVWNVEHCGGEPEQAANMHMNRLSFTLKWWAESVAFMSRLCTTLTWSDLNPAYNFVRSASSLPLMVGSVRSCRACLNLSCLRYGLPTLHSGSSPALPCHALHLSTLQLPTKCTRTFNFREIFKRAFKIYGIWPQGRIHTHLRNAVPLVWGSLRLAPITVGSEPLNVAV